MLYSGNYMGVSSLDFGDLGLVVTLCWIMFITCRKLDGKIQKTLKEYLEARGVNDELAVFLHEYMTNKDRNELIRWLANVKNFVEK